MSEIVGPLFLWLGGFLIGFAARGWFARRWPHLEARMTK
jgi:hypothetical protein